MMRGQTLPLWLGSTLLTIVFAFFIGSYGNVISYQFRAQAAADSIANAAVSIQSQEFNQMTEGLYAAGVEEYRLRHILEAIRITATDSGGCNVSNSCADTWATLIQGYRRSLARYDADASLVSNVTYNMNFPSFKADATELVNEIRTACTNPGTSSFAYSLDCNDSTKNFQIHLTNIQQRTNLGAVIGNEQENLLPSYYNTGKSTADINTFGPVAVEVAVCAVVPPIFPQVFGAMVKPTIVVARAAATNAMVEQDWIQPGNAKNPDTNGLFQPIESYGSGTGENWYSVNFGGNASQTSASPTNPALTSIRSDVANEEFSARTGWWGPLPILPFTRIQNASALGAGCS